METADLRNLNKDDLLLKLASFKEELCKLNYQRRSGRVDKPHHFKQLRKTIARIKTILREGTS